MKSIAWRRFDLSHSEATSSHGNVMHSGTYATPFLFACFICNSRMRPPGRHTSQWYQPATRLGGHRCCISSSSHIRAPCFTHLHFMYRPQQVL
jgi:hypothetical protein